jgi:hypothetical protein
MVIQMFRLLSVICIAVLTTLIAVPSQSDDITINLDPTTPYVDVPITVTEPVDATIQTNTGTPGPGWIDSWIEVWQGANRLAFNDDGAHSATNYLASIITMPLQIGEYIIKATSYAYRCCSALPTGSYILNTNLVIVTPTPTLSLSPSPSMPEENSPSPSPTPVPSSSEPTDGATPEPSSLSPSPSDTPYPTSYPEVQEPQVQEPSLPSPVVSPTFSEPEPSPLPSVQDTLEAVVDSSPSVSPSSSVPSLLGEEYLEPDTSIGISFLNVDISLPPLLSEAVQLVFESITDSLKTISNLGSEFTPEEREQAQQVVLGAIIITQLAAPRRIK